MSTLPDTTYKKATQALNFFAEKKGGEINKMKAIKLIYFADRLHLRKYGRPIIGDAYWAMKLGPVGSHAKNIAELADGARDVLAYAKKYLRALDGKLAYVSHKPTDRDVFSETDLECLESVYKVFADKDQFELAKLSHFMPEWKKHLRELRTGKKRVRMEYGDFFAETKVDFGLFRESASDLAHAKEIFEESKHVADFFAT